MKGLDTLAMDGAFKDEGTPTPHIYRYINTYIYINSHITD